MTMHTNTDQQKPGSEGAVTGGLRGGGGGGGGAAAATTMSTSFKQKSKRCEIIC